MCAPLVILYTAAYTVQCSPAVTSTTCSGACKSEAMCSSCTALHLPAKRCNTYSKKSKGEYSPGQLPLPLAGQFHVGFPQEAFSRKYMDLMSSDFSGVSADTCAGSASLTRIVLVCVVGTAGPCLILTILSHCPISRSMP